MDNKLLRIEKQRLNIFQKIRLELVKRKKEITFEEYIRMPKYIKKEKKIINRLVKENELTEKQLLQLPEYELMSLFASNKNFITKFSKEQQVRWIESGYIQIYIYSDQERNELLLDMIQNGSISSIKLLNNYIYEKNFLEYLKERESLNQYLPVILIELSNNTKTEILKHKPNLLCYLKREEQIQFFQQNTRMFQYASAEIQLEYINDNPQYFSMASLDAKQMFIDEDEKNIERLDVASQIEMVTSNPNLYNNISYKARREIFKGYKPKLKTIASLLKEDINNSKNLEFLDEHSYTHGGMNELLFELFDGVEQLEDENVIDRILHCKMFSAIGSLTPDGYSFHSIDGGNGSEAISGIDGYCKAQIQIIKKLNYEQIGRLISIDSNYILPYLAEINESNCCVLSEDERELAQTRCEELFSTIYGKENFEKYKEVINIIFDMQMSKNEEISKRYGYREDVSLLLKQGEVPLEEFKIIFNKKIIDANSSKIIEQYLKEKSKGKDGKGLLEEIIINAYGENARKILESRPTLDVYSINSLEVFDEDILAEYGEAFVHDCISYNLRDFSEFLEVQKNPQKKKLFRIYYNTLVSIYGANVETMQKAISEYSYIEELLTQAENIELTDTQYENLISIFCSRRNPFNIANLSDLQNYEEIANQQLTMQINETLISIRQGKENQDILKEIISENFLGMRYKNYYNTNYGDSVDYITALYDIQTETGKDETYTEDERKMLDVLEFLKNEESSSKLVELANLLKKEKGIRNPIVLQTALQKTKSQQIEILNKSLLSMSKLEELCEREKDSENPSVYMEQEDGLKIYHLNGIPYTFLAHDSFANNEDFMEYDGQAGNTAICTRVVNQTEGVLDRKFLYTSIDNDMLISASPWDAKTTHIAKRVRNKGRIDTKIKDISGLSNIESGNEVAFYRRYRKHNSINNENHGGRNFPDAYGIVSIEDLTDEIKAFCKKYNISIVFLHGEKYQHREQLNEEIER